jgi:peptidoglycan/LPS O-acetylase OafA/YrhL
MLARPLGAASGTRADRTTDFPLIDVLRGFAALSVVVFHVIAHFNWTSFPISGPLVWFRIGGMGVDLFFVISGFVIALSAFARLSRGGFADFVRSFSRARIARIVPLYYLTGLVFIVFIQPELVFVPDIWKQVLSHGLFVHSWFLMHQGGINGVNWSVSVEMQFYLLMLLSAPWLRRANWLLIGMGGVAVAWSWRAGVYLLVDPNGQWGTFPIFVYTTELPGMLDEFAAGVLLARIILSPKGQALLMWARPRPWVLPVAATIAVTVALQIYWRNSTYWNSGVMVIAFKTVLAVACAVVVLSACALQYPMVVQLTAPLRYLGTISYGIYLWHLPIIFALKRVSWVEGPKALPAVIMLTLLFASLSWHFFERPLMQRFGSRVKGGAADVAEVTSEVPSTRDIPGEREVEVRYAVTPSSAIMGKVHLISRWVPRTANAWMRGR